MENETVKKIEDLVAQCQKRNRITHTNFLDPETKASVARMLSRVCKDTGVKYLCIGGFEEAERAAYFFLPFFEEEDLFPASEYMRVVKMIPSAKKEYSHRDYLGSVMALGIDREKMGDIIIHPDCAQMIVFANIAEYIKMNLTRISNTGAEVTVQDMEALILPEKQLFEMKHSVASMRADCVVACAFRVSRAESVALIKKGLVSVNWREILKPDLTIGSGDMLACKGRERVKIEDTGECSRKGKIYLKMIYEK